MENLDTMELYKKRDTYGMTQSVSKFTKMASIWIFCEEKAWRNVGTQPKYSLEKKEKRLIV